jgi:hypothetical protein
MVSHKNVIFVLPPHQVTCKCNFFRTCQDSVWLYWWIVKTAFLFEKMAPIVSEFSEGSEDCLYLNVYTKATKAPFMTSYGIYSLILRTELRPVCWITSQNLSDFSGRKKKFCVPITPPPPSPTPSRRPPWTWVRGGRMDWCLCKLPYLL